MSFKIQTRVNPVFHSMDDFSLNRVLGTGAFAVVYEATHLSTGDRYAVKRVDFNKISDLDRENVEKELEVHIRLNFDHIVRLVDFLLEENVLYMILELCTNGNLYRYMNRRRLRLYDIKKIFRQTCLAIEYLHNLGIIMRDLKPENLILDRMNNVKLCDFGWAAQETDTDYCKIKAGTYAYMSPESLSEQLQTRSTDIWSLGIFLYELYYNKEPFPGEECEEVLKAIDKFQVDFDDQIDIEGKEFILLLLQSNAQKRPSIEIVLQNKYFKSLFEVGYKDPPKTQLLMEKNTKTIHEAVKQKDLVASMERSKSLNVVVSSIANLNKAAENVPQTKDTKNNSASSLPPSKSSNQTLQKIIQHESKVSIEEKTEVLKTSSEVEKETADSFKINKEQLERPQNASHTPRLALQKASSIPVKASISSNTQALVFRYRNQLNNNSKDSKKLSAKLPNFKPEAPKAKEVIKTIEPPHSSSTVNLVNYFSQNHKENPSITSQYNSAHIDSFFKNQLIHKPNQSEKSKFEQTLAHASPVLAAHFINNEKAKNLTILKTNVVSPTPVLSTNHSVEKSHQTHFTSTDLKLSKLTPGDGNDPKFISRFVLNNNTTEYSSLQKTFSVEKSTNREPAQLLDPQINQYAKIHQTISTPQQNYNSIKPVEHANPIQLPSQNTLSKTSDTFRPISRYNSTSQTNLFKAISRHEVITNTADKLSTKSNQYYSTNLRPPTIDATAISKPNFNFAEQETTNKIRLTNTDNRETAPNAYFDNLMQPNLRLQPKATSEQGSNSISEQKTFYLNSQSSHSPYISQTLLAPTQSISGKVTMPQSRDDKSPFRRRTIYKLDKDNQYSKSYVAFEPLIN